MRDLKYAQDMGTFCYELFFIESSFAFSKFIDSLQGLVCRPGDLRAKSLELLQD